MVITLVICRRIHYIGTSAPNGNSFKYKEQLQMKSMDKKGLPSSVRLIPDSMHADAPSNTCKSPLQMISPSEVAYDTPCVPASEASLPGEIPASPVASGSIVDGQTIPDGETIPETVAASKSTNNFVTCVSSERISAVENGPVPVSGSATYVSCDGTISVASNLSKCSLKSLNSLTADV